MINKKAMHEIRTRVVKKFGDLEILHKFFTSWGIYRLIMGDKSIWLEWLNDLWWLTVGMFANSLAVVFRYRHGVQTMGIVLMVLVSAMMLVLNSILFPRIINPLALYASISLFSELHIGGMPMFELLHMQSRSDALLVFICLYLLFAIVHIVQMYVGYANTEPSKRGDSWLCRLLPTKVRGNKEFIVQAFIEPLVAISVGITSWKLDDPYFAVFLWVAAGCLFLQEMQDEAAHSQNRPAVPLGGR